MGLLARLFAASILTATVAACASPEPPPPPPRPAVAVLDCTQAVWSGSPYGQPPHGVTLLSGSPFGVGIYGTPGTAPWGLVCLNGYTRTGCNIAPDTRFAAYSVHPAYPALPTAVPLPDFDDWDLRSDGTPEGNGCYTTRPELISRAAISISCCRIAEQR
ncbi:hypothetical protein EDC65_2598 [Stella humosa]|uniref:Uncharacterized protein n=1 Tax=Stella humosa TaxID=94 RepID=A0A3N1LCI2_9PROT|nr:hypothetical protein [Stella humosa]ROP90741.1 hypothetical protein EDC65_2598 [Stella humosa]BBK34916.1 hypothetical protein STHU_55500 [Stella humosa]